MTGVRLVARFEVDRVQAAITQLEGLGRNSAPMMWAIGVAMVRNTGNRMDGSVDATGAAWAPLLPAYAAIKRGPGILRESLGLQRSLTFEAANGAVLWGSDKIYAAVHQFGGVITVKNAKFLRFKLAGGWVSRKSVKIPARPYLGIDATDERDIIEVVDGFYERALQGRAI